MADLETHGFLVVSKNGPGGVSCTFVDTDRVEDAEAVADEGQLLYSIPFSSLPNGEYLAHFLKAFPTPSLSETSAWDALGQLFEAALLADRKQRSAKRRKTKKR